MNTYKVRVYLVTSVDVEVEAENADDALWEARCSDVWEGDTHTILANLALDDSLAPDVLDERGCPI